MQHSSFIQTEMEDPVSCGQHSYFGPCPFEEVWAGGGSLIACDGYGV